MPDAEQWIEELMAQYRDDLLRLGFYVIGYDRRYDSLVEESVQDPYHFCFLLQ